jgi:hypothetical protein
LPETVHDQSTYRVWQRRFYDFNVWSEKKAVRKPGLSAGQPG